MTSGQAQDKVTKLLALAAPGSGASPDEAATAARIAKQICSKYGVAPIPPRSTTAGTGRALPGQVDHNWRPSRPQPQGQGWGWWPWAARPFGSSAPGVSGINDDQARQMALKILTSGAFLDADEFEIVEGALNGLLTEYGKILLDGLYALI